MKKNVIIYYLFNQYVNEIKLQFVDFYGGFESI